MGSYYYLVAQLPYLMYGQAAPMSSQAFKELAASLLNAHDAALLDKITLNPQLLDGEPSPSSGSDFIDQWQEWDRTFSLNLAKHRAVKLGREGANSIEAPNMPADAAAIAAKAVASTESPLEVEMFIDRARWNAVEALQGNDYFDRKTIFAYLLKLLILERRAVFQVEKGFSEYKSLYASILESVQSGALAAGESK